MTNWYGASTTDLIEEARRIANVGTGDSFHDAIATRLSDAEQTLNAAIRAIGADSVARFSPTLDGLDEYDRTGVLPARHDCLDGKVFTSITVDRDVVAGWTPCPTCAAEPVLSEERIASIQKGIAQSRAGLTRPLDEVLDELGLNEDPVETDGDIRWSLGTTDPPHGTTLRYAATWSAGHAPVDPVGAAE